MSNRVCAVRYWLGFLLLSSGALIGIGRQESIAAAPPDQQQLRVIAESYQANKSVFTNGKCRFSYSIRTAKSESDAIAEKWSDDRQPVSNEMLLFFQGDRTTLKTDLDNDRLVDAIENSKPVITPINIAIKGGYALDHDGLINTAIVHSPANNHLNVRMHPFNLSDDSQGLDVASVLAYSEAMKFDNIEILVEEDVVRDGRKYLLVKRIAKDDSHDAHYYIDPDRGYLPFVTEYFEKSGSRDLFSRMLLLDVHQEGDAYFPMRSVKLTFRKPSEDVRYLEVREMKVVDLDLKYYPTADDFTLRLPKHTQYSDGVNPNTAKTLFRDGKAESAPVSVNDIEEIYNKLQRLAAERAIDEATIPARPGRSVRQWYWVIGLNVVVISGVLLYLVRRRFYKQS